MHMKQQHCNEQQGKNDVTVVPEPQAVHQKGWTPNSDKERNYLSSVQRQKNSQCHDLYITHSAG